jgi:hypothetical protein
MGVIVGGRMAFCCMKYQFLSHGVAISLVAQDVRGFSFVGWLGQSLEHGGSPHVPCSGVRRHLSPEMMMETHAFPGLALRKSGCRHAPSSGRFVALEE